MFLAACVAAHGSHFFVCTNRINVLNLKCGVRIKGFVICESGINFLIPQIKNLWDQDPFFTNCFFHNITLKWAISFFLLWFTPCKAEQPLRGMELQEKEAQEDCNISEICLEKT